MKLSSIIKLIFTLSLVALLSFGAPYVAKAANKNAIFAGGCFWCLEHDFEGLSGVISVESGYSGGNLDQPTYKNHKGHQESVIVSYNPQLIDFETLLRQYWRNIDPFDSKGQFCDRGDSYKPVIFVSDQLELDQANKSLIDAAKELDVSIDSIKVSIKDVSKFWAAEDYHQDFAELNNIKYNFYRYSCGRDKRLKEVWRENAGRSEGWANAD